MDYVRLGSTGTKVSRICLGCMSFGTPGSSGMWTWTIGEEASQDFVRRAIEAGINFFDTADIYSSGESEEILGRAIKAIAPARESIVVATKLFNPMGASPNERGLSRKHIRHAIDNSLRRLGLDYVDLYQIHRYDPNTPVEETLDALTDLVRAGKVLHIGGSSMWAWQFNKYLNASDRHGYARFVTMQNHYNLLYREEEREMNPLCRAEGVGLIPWSPLAGGVLVGNRAANTPRSKIPWGQDRYRRPEDLKIIDTVAEIAQKREEKPAVIGLAWLLSKPEVTAPIVGVTKAHHLDDAVRAAGLKLEPAEIEALEAPYLSQSVVGHV